MCTIFLIKIPKKKESENKHNEGIYSHCYKVFTIILDNKQIFEGFSIYAPTDVGLI